MNNDRKKITSQGATTEIKSRKAARKLSRTLGSSAGKIGIEIRNLPDNFTMTQEILRNNICRICATYYESGPQLVPLYQHDEGTRPLAKIVNAFLPVRVREDDGLPKFACRACSGKLHAWRATVDSCAEVQKILYSQAELLDGMQIHNRTENRTLHFVDLMDSSDEEGAEGTRAPPSPPPPAPPPEAQVQWRYLLGSWAR